MNEKENEYITAGVDFLWYFLIVVKIKLFLYRVKK